MSKKYLDLDGLEEVVEQINAKYAQLTDIPTTPSEVGALPATTKYGASVTASVNSSTYVCTFQLKDQDGNNLGNPATIDLPIESAIVSASYDNTTKDLTFTLQNGNTITVPLDAIISGLQAEITSSNKLSADLVTDSSTTNKFVTATEKTTWNGKQNALVSGTNIKTINGSSILGSGDLDTKDIKEITTSTNIWELAVGVYKGTYDNFKYSTNMPLGTSSDNGIVIVYKPASSTTRQYIATNNNGVMWGTAHSNSSNASRNYFSLIYVADDPITTAEIEALF